MKNKKVDFLIIGAQKAGTTSLYEYLNQHPNIEFSSIKEILFFSDERLYCKGEKLINSYFEKNTNENIRIRGTADVQLLHSLKGPERVFEYNNDMKLIVVLRDPVARAYSAFNFAKQKSEENENKSFKMAFDEFVLKFDDKYTRNEDDGFDYFYDGLYYKHLSNWMSFFPKSQIHIVTFSNLITNTNDILHSVWSFLGLKPIPLEDNVKSNETGYYRFPKIQKFLFNRNSIFSKTAGLFLNRRIKNYLRINVVQPIRKNSFRKKNIISLHSLNIEEIKEFYQEDKKLLNELLEQCKNP